MEMRNYIDIVEAFGRDEEGEMDKRLVKAHPKSFREKLSGPLSAAVWLAAAYGGAKYGISWLDAKETGEKILAGGLGTIVGSLLGIVPSALVKGIAGRNKARTQAKEKEIDDFISKNPKIKTDLEKFVQMLISQTPTPILEKLQYLEHVYMFNKVPKAVYTGDDEKIKLAVKNLAGLISNYFDQQDEKWQKLAAKYKVDSPTLYQIWEHIGGINHIHGIGWEWENGVKKMVSAPMNEEPIEEASDDSIARIVELSQDKK